MNEERIAHLRDLLREDERVRSHFDMQYWAAPCGTVGCIAGWATKIWEPKLFMGAIGLSASLEGDGASILSLDRRTAGHLFVPSKWYDYLTEDHGTFANLSHNLRPSLLTVKAMKEWAETLGDCGDRLWDLIGPDQAANALTGLLTHPGYIDWHEACEGAH